jgi:Mg2+/citrate symporter
MTLFIAALAILGLLICVFFAWFWREQERARVARQWIERERLLDRRPPPASRKEVRRRRGRRHRRARVASLRR